MTRLAVTDAVDRARAYGHAVVSFLDADGYPTSVAGSFTTDPAAGAVEVGPFHRSTMPVAGQEICVTFSHIRPRVGVGYDERRYVNVWGPATIEGDRVRVVATQAAGWDDEELPFFEYAERSVPTAHEYMADVGARPRLSAWWTFFLATRLPFLTATLVPV